MKLTYGRWFAKFVDAETDPELEPATSELTYSASTQHLVSWADVPTAVRYADTVGVFVEQFPMQWHLYQLSDALSAQLQGMQASAFISEPVEGLPVPLPPGPGGFHGASGASRYA